MTNANTTPKFIAIQWFERVWNQKDPKAIHEILDASCIGRSEGGVVQGPDAFLRLIHEPLLAAFPDIQVRIEGIVAEGDETVTRWSATATHSGPFLDLPISNRRVTFSGMTWFRFRNGKIIHGEDRYNLHALIQYLSTGQTSTTVLPPQ